MEDKEKTTNSDENPYINKRKNVNILSECEGDYSNVSLGEDKINRNDLLTIFDSCYSFTCEIDETEVLRLSRITTQLAHEPMKSVWRPRSEHHIYLLIDGLCKHRCLFKDYDSTFTPKQEDYDMAERILIRMVKAWDTDLSPKEDIK